ncbi:putative iron-sulfur cluster binding protein yccm [hydrocarbon metagenome]|uniref:Putative iron-sulfur cluster binding protein yccm n=1 Tax=hydrocarbon metagenome TaxID=938273 RepID=A0A0W8FF46_9ZZZZ|nr:4Fe-4S binding protein [Methanomicrobiaceae archaeon]
MFGAGSPPTPVIGIVYAIMLTFVAAFLWKTGRFTARIRGVLLASTVILGFATFSPMIPHQFQALLIGLGTPAGTILFAGLAGLSLFALLAFLFGRHFCGYLCPIGAVQEAAYLIPVRKIRLPGNPVMSGIRGAVFLVIVFAAVVYKIAVLDLSGFQDFFGLTLSAPLFAFLLILAVGAVFYRPFCRLICPVAVILQIAALGARWKIRRTDACIRCGRCEKACPTDEAKAGDLRSECYLCRRCLEVCPVEGALYYGGKKD